MAYEDAAREWIYEYGGFRQALRRIAANPNHVFCWFCGSQPNAIAVLTRMRQRELRAKHRWN